MLFDYLFSNMIGDFFMTDRLECPSIQRNSTGYEIKQDKDGNTIVKMLTPSINKETIDINLSQGTAGYTIFVNRDSKKEEEEEGKRITGSIFPAPKRMSFNLSPRDERGRLTQFNVENITAEVKGDFLKILFPVKTAAAPPGTIKIKVV